MKMPIGYFAAALLVASFLSLPMPTARAATIVEPGGTTQDTLHAFSDPAEYAWQLFLYLNHQAKPGLAGVADENKLFGNLEPGTSAVWETWAMASGREASEVYRPDGARPLDWDQLPRGGSRQLILDRNLERLSVLSSSKRLKPFFFPTEPLQQEVRQNRPMFEFVLSKEMYHRGGLEALLKQAQAQNNRTIITFPNGAKEIKAQWYPIREADKPRYFWRDVKNSDGSTSVFGLVSLHIITKDLPNWLWADFGHIDCEKQEGACDPASVKPFLDPTLQEEAKTDPNDPTTRGASAPNGSNGVRKETMGSVWENYILRGTQTEFVNSFGQPTILSNPVIENTFQNSSCMTCHARASVGGRGTGATGAPASSINKLSVGDPTLGAPDPALVGAGLGQNDTIDYLQTDFIWSAPFRAQRKPGT